MSDLKQIVSDKLLNYRAKKNLTQKDLAAKLKISNRTISLIENQDDEITILTLLKVKFRLEDLEEKEE
jgi:transcriptional regulator with XRE-family HTH domain